MWTEFIDANTKEQKLENQIKHVYIEAPRNVAIEVFKRKFKYNPNQLDKHGIPEYDAIEHDTLAQATAFRRGCMFDFNTKLFVEIPDSKGFIPYQTLEEFLQRKDVLTMSKL